MLCAHSFYSFGRGVLSPQTLCREAARQGVTHIALADTGGIYGFVNFLDAARAHGINPIAAVTLSLEEGDLVVLAEGREGYAAMCKLITAYHGVPRPRFQALFRKIEPAHLVLLGRNERLLLHAVEWNGSTNTFVALGVGPDAATGASCATKLGIEAVAAPLVYASCSNHENVHRLQRAIALRTSLDRIPPRELWPNTGFSRTPGDIEAIKRTWPEAWRGSCELAQRCAIRWSFEKPILPSISPSAKDAAQRLRQLAFSGATERYTAPRPAELRPQLEHELEVIISRGLADYFLVVYDLVKHSPVTCGRGSAASSLVSYCLGITHVDPLAADLYFDRFLGPGRTDIPDIDVDFPWDERHDVIRRLFGSRPSGEVALVSNHVTFGVRAAVRETGHVLGMTEGELAELTRNMHGSDHDPGGAEGFGDTAFSPHTVTNVRMKRLLKLAEGLKGLPRHLSRHCGGVVMVSGGIDGVVPYEPLPDGLHLIQWEKDQAEAAGLVKIDLLGNRSLALVRDAIKWVNVSGETTLSYRSLKPLDDPSTMDLLAKGNTMGIFYVESPAMRQLQRKAGTGEFESLVVHSSLIRPAANRWISEYVQRLRAGSHPTIHPALDRLLEESQGILCYQEDVMRVAVELAGFDFASADRLRRTLSKKGGQPLEELAQRFRRGLRDSGLTKEQAEVIWSMVESFAGYSFCKAHSASYALVSFKAAYLKAHFPAEFMAALLSNGGGYYTAQAYVSELRRMGLDLLPPDINLAGNEYVPLHQGVRVGFAQIKSLGENDIARLLHCRTEGDFVSMEDLLTRCPLSVPAVRGLILSGSFDSFHGPASRVPLLRALASRNATKRPGALDLLPAPPRLYHGVPDERLQRFQELDVLGFPLKGHPLDLVPLPAGFDPCPTPLLAERIEARVRLVGWMVISKPVRTRSGEKMAFVSFEDREDIYETVFFPKAYKRFGPLLKSGRPFLVSGTATEEWGSLTLAVDNIQPLPFQPPWSPQ